MTVGIGSGNPLADLLFCGLAGVIVGALSAETFRLASVPPGNRFEKLKGDRANSYSIRINDQWRVCFRWTTAGREDIEIVGYH